jgi:TonB-linked SusC/RagA family outer membrane protein
MSFSACTRATLFFMCLFVFLLPLMSSAQTTTLRGRVTDPEGGPLQSVSVTLKGTSVGTTTRADGTYSINFTKRGNEVLVFSSVGFADKEVPVGNSTEVNSQLERAADQSLNAVVVVGYGTQKKRDVTGAVASIPKERLQQLPNNNILSAIQGSVPGVAVSQGSASAEGNGQSILIRGRKSISASTDPLIIWDGIPYVGGISDINPNDVESIEILKDASASAIYGSRGANGVILVTSKQGTRGKLTVTYDGSYSIQTLTNRPDLLTGPEFADFKRNRKNANTNTLSTWEQAVLDNGKWVDWYDLATQNGSRTQHNLSVRGGSEKSTFYMGGTYLNVKGVVKNDEYRRYSLRPNLEIKLTSWLTFNTSSQISFSDRSGLPADFDDTRNTGGGANFFTPLSKPFKADGSIEPYADSSNTQSRNPLSNLLVKNKDNTYKIFTANSLKVDLAFIKGLSYRLNTGVEYENNQRKTYYGRNVAIGIEAKGDAINFNSIDRNFTIENILNYTREFGKHSINLTALYSSQSEDYDRDQVEGVGFPNDVLTNYQMNAATLVTVSSTNYKQNLLSQMGRLNYGYAGKYLLTFTARRDGYSAFGKGKKYGVFPVGALAWNVTQENFMKNINFLSNLKIRASYGLSGNQAVSSYVSLATLTSANYLDGTTVLPGYIPNKLSNEDLGWETTKSFSIGMDFGLFRNRIQGSLDIYSTKTKDLLLLRQISPVQGITEVLQNIGRTSGKGVDIGITSTNINSKDFTWSTNANFSFNSNKIVDVYGDGRDDVGNRWFIGQPIRVAYGLKYGGIFHSRAEAMASAQPNDSAGYVRAVDIDGDGVINTSKDRTILGNLDPKFIWGFTNTFKYRNFSLMIFFQGIDGLIKANELQSDNVFADTRRNTVQKDWWTSSHTDATHYSNDANANKLSVPFYEDGGFARLKDLSIAYQLPASFLSRFKITSLKFYITGRNLATFTKYKGLDPELNNQNGLPLQRDVLVGLTLGL